MTSRPGGLPISRSTPASRPGLTSSPTANEGLLTAEERSEYEAFINARHVITILKLKARGNLTANGG